MKNTVKDVKYNTIGSLRLILMYIKLVIRYINLEKNMTISNLPLVTVVIPSYNHASYVKESIQSIIDQDYSNIELIIVDDGSKDNSIDVINEMVAICQKRFTRFEFRHRPNKGLCATLNEALDWSKGEYFSPIASDDIALPHKISFLVSKIINTDYSAVFGNIQQIGSGSTKSALKIADGYEHFFDELLLGSTSLPAPAALIKTNDIQKVGCYDENFALEDLPMWLKLAEKGKKLVSYNTVVTQYRRHDGNTVNNAEHMYLSRQQVINLYRNHHLFAAATQRNLYIKASHIASNQTIEPMKILIKSRMFNKKGAVLLMKALTPKILIKLKRRIAN